MKNLPKLIVSIIACELVGILGTPFTLSAIPAWYSTLNKPGFSPPGWIFGPVWTLLYFFMGISFYLIWVQGWKHKRARTAGKFFLLQLGVNFLWSPIFFGLRSPILGFITIIVLWFLIVITMRKFYPLSKPAFYLLVPYFLWVSFTTLLNATIVLLN